MSILQDFTLNNPFIKEYFDFKEGSQVPVREFKYLHEHPLIYPNFISQVDTKVQEAVLILSEGKTRDSRTKALLNLTKTLGTLLSSYKDEDIPRVLEVLRKVYRTCVDITGTQ